MNFQVNSDCRNSLWSTVQSSNLRQWFSEDLFDVWEVTTVWPRIKFSHPNLDAFGHQTCGILFMMMHRRDIKLCMQGCRLALTLNLMLWCPLVCLIIKACLDLLRTVYFIPKSRKPTLYLGLITAMCFAGPVQNQALPKIWNVLWMVQLLLV